MKNLQTVISLSILVLLGIILFRDCSSKPVDNTLLYDSLRDEIDSLKISTNKRDTLIIESQEKLKTTVNTVNNYITDYQAEEDTVRKIQKCDSLIKYSQELTKQALSNDSLHAEQEQELKLTITKQDTVITGQDKIITKEKRWKNVWKTVAIGASAATLALLVKRR